MQIAKYTTTKEIINNFFRNTAYNEHVNLGDMAFWVYEAMGLIGNPMQYIPKIKGHIEEEAYDLADYRVELPCDFHKLIAVAIDGTLAIPSQGLFHHLMDGACCGVLSENYPQEEFMDNFGNVFSPQALPLNTRVGQSTPTFTLNNNYITFNTKEGKVCMAYWAFPLDNEGFPLIPDDVKYKRAVTSYLQYKIDYIMWRQDLLTDKVYAQSKDDWEWNVASAISHLKMPDLNQMEGMRRQFSKMIIRTEEFYDGFHSLNNPGYRGRY
jgi:hypothetical protein